MTALLLLGLGCPYGVDEVDPGGDVDSARGDSTPTDSSVTPTDDSGTTDPGPPTMDPVRLLARISLDLRGVRPTDAEIAAVQDDPAALDTLVDTFLGDPRFPTRLVELYGEDFLTLTEAYPIDAEDYGLDEDPLFKRSVGEEPLRILAQIAAEDDPWYTIVTADWTMADERLGAVWPLDYPDAATGWRKVHYTDGRPSAGILSTNALWWRYRSTESNANRKRANAVSRILLCNDYLTRPIEFDRTANLLSADAVNEAISTDPACVGCHNTLDPLGSYFYGFFYFEIGSTLDASVYHPERESLWSSLTGVAPGYYGEPGYNLSDLSYQIASDPRLAECAVESGWRLLLRRDRLTEDMDALTRHREAFLEGGLTLRALYRSLVTDPAYRAGPTDDPAAVPTKLLTSELLSSAVADLTGFRWTVDGADMLETDQSGLRTLAGGTDGITILRTATSPNVTGVLVQQRLAELAGRYAVDTERRVSPANRRLFKEIDFTETPVTNPDGMKAQVQALYLRLFARAVTADSEEVTAALGLWEELYAYGGSVSNAWTGVLIVLLRDPDFVLY